MQERTVFAPESSRINKHKGRRKEKGSKEADVYSLDAIRASRNGALHTVGDQEVAGPGERASEGGLSRVNCRGDGFRFREPTAVRPLKLKHLFQFSGSNQITPQRGKPLRTAEHKTSAGHFSSPPSSPSVSINSAPYWPVSCKSSRLRAPPQTEGNREIDIFVSSLFIAF